MIHATFVHPSTGDRSADEWTRNPGADRCRRNRTSKGTDDHRPVSEGSARFVNRLVQASGFRTRSSMELTLKPRRYATLWLQGVFWADPTRAEYACGKGRLCATPRFLVRRHGRPQIGAPT